MYQPPVKASNIQWHKPAKVMLGSLTHYKHQGLTSTIPMQLNLHSKQPMHAAATPLISQSTICFKKCTIFNTHTRDVHKNAIFDGSIEPLGIS